jgi:hypothetical protein
MLATRTHNAATRSRFSTLRVRMQAVVGRALDCGS